MASIYSRIPSANVHLKPKRRTLKALPRKLSCTQQPRCWSSSHCDVVVMRLVDALNFARVDFILLTDIFDDMIEIRRVECVTKEIDMLKLSQEDEYKVELQLTILDHRNADGTRGDIKTDEDPPEQLSSTFLFWGRPLRQLKLNSFQSTFYIVMRPQTLVTSRSD
ncbi:hypothetical protein PV325_006832 [Microctonus aethiopoides]|nr:hypothetical protein PV325_006832 [Microctonus aethiopoides]